MWFARYNGTAELEVFPAGTITLARFKDGYTEMAAIEQTTNLQAVSMFLHQAAPVPVVVERLLYGASIWRTMKDRAVIGLPSVFEEYGMVLWLSKEQTIEEAKTEISTLMAVEGYMTVQQTMGWHFVANDST